MPTARTLLPMLALLLAGCTTPPADGDSAPAAAPAMSTQCRAERVQAFVGHAWSAALSEQARVDSASASVRVIRPGTAVTRDYRVDRLNLHLDGSGVVTRISCG